MNLDAFMQVAPFAESIHVTVTQALHKHFEFDGYCSYDSVFDALCVRRSQTCQSLTSLS